jgi:hypothetical protein
VLTTITFNSQIDIEFDKLVKELDKKKPEDSSLKSSSSGSDTSELTEDLSP